MNSRENSCTRDPRIRDPRNDPEMMDVAIDQELVESAVTLVQNAPPQPPSISINEESENS